MSDGRFLVAAIAASATLVAAGARVFAAGAAIGTQPSLIIVQVPK
jgi:hypothetical protein